MDSEPVGMVFNWSANFHLSGACCAKVSLGLRAAIHTITKRKEKEMEEIGSFILRVMENIDNETELLKIKEKVKALCLKFPLYQ